MITRESSFIGEKGASIFYRVWAPDAGRAKAVILLTHGYAEHAGRYHGLARYLTDHGYMVYAPDHRAHGRSGGTKALIEDIHDIVQDMHTLRGRIANEQPGKKVFVLGHSMGGTLTTLYAQTYPEELDGCIVSGVGLMTGAGVSPALKAISRLVAAIAPQFPLQELKSEWLSHDPAVVHDYDTDPLNYRGKVMARTGTELLRGADCALTNIGAFCAPVLCMHGGGDQLVDPDASRYFYESVSSTDKTLKIFDGLYHEICNEYEKDEVYALVGDWLDRRA
jgi:alpha-beta hydrolase superfamily lysophospholipase